MQHLLVREEHGMRPGGYGVLLARQLVDELLYSEKGNEVLLVENAKSGGDWWGGSLSSAGGFPVRLSSNCSAENVLVVKTTVAVAVVAVAVVSEAATPIAAVETNDRVAITVIAVVGITATVVRAAACVVRRVSHGIAAAIEAAAAKRRRSVVVIVSGRLKGLLAVFGGYAQRSRQAEAQRSFRAEDRGLAACEQNPGDASNRSDAGADSGACATVNGGSDGCANTGGGCDSGGIGSLRSTGRAFPQFGGDGSCWPSTVVTSVSSRPS